MKAEGYWPVPFCFMESPRQLKKLRGTGQYPSAFHECFQNFQDKVKAEGYQPVPLSFPHVLAFWNFQYKKGRSNIT